MPDRPMAQVNILFQNTDTTNNHLHPFTFAHYTYGSADIDLEV